MKHIFLSLFVTSTLSAFGQTRDSVRYYVDLNDCDSLVWWEDYSIVNAKGKEIYKSSNPIGYDKKTPCLNQIPGRDTVTLVSFFKNTQIIDPGRGHAKLISDHIAFTNQEKAANFFNKAIKAATGKDLFLEVEKEFADSLLGQYRLHVRSTTTKKEDCVMLRRPNGQVVIRTGTGANIKNYPLRFFSEEKIEVTGLPGDNDKTMIFLFNKTKGIYSTPDKKIQLLKSDKFAIENLTVK